MSRASTLSGFTTAIGQPTNLNVGVLTCQTLSSSDVTFTDDLSLKNLNATSSVNTPGLIVTGISTLGTTGSDSLFINGGTDSNATSNLRFRNNAGNVNYGFIRNQANNFTFGTNGTDPVFLETSNIRRVTITSAGLVGIGTTAPLATFSVKTGTDAIINFTTMSSEAALETSNDAGLANVTMRYRAADHKFFIGGSEKVRIASDGNVGIGTDNPSDDLSILSTANSLVIGCKDSTRGNHIFQLLADDPAGNGELRLYQNSASGTHAKTVEIASSGNSYINSGSVGIGTDNPDSNSQLHTIGTSYWPILVKTTSTGGGGIAIKDKDDTTSLYTGTGGGSWLTGSAITDGLIRAQNNLLFASNGNNEAMRLDSSGRLLIGITEGISVNGQNCAFQVEGVNAATSRISIINRGNNSTGGGIQIAKSRGTIPHNVADDDQVGGIFFCAADGNDFDGQSARIECYIDGLPGGNDVPGRLTFSATPDVTDSPVERLRIDSSGRLLIPNTNVDNFKLQVAATNGATVSCQNYQNNDDGAEVNFLKSRSTTVGGQGLLSNNDYIGRIFFRGSDGGNFDRAVEIAVKVDGAPAASDMPGRIEFMTTPSGSDVPTATMTLKANKNVEIHSGNIVIETSGKGIDFSANTSGSGTATSNILDDYEEGSWTATFSGASTAGTYTVSTTACRYTKIGDTVNLIVDMKNITTVSAGSGLLRISGLPFNPSNGNEAGSVILEFFDFPTSVSYAVLRASTSTNGLLLVGMRNGQSDIQFSVTDKTSDIADIFGQITYKTAS